MPDQPLSVGRIVHFYDGAAGPYAAIVTTVHSPTCGNLHVFEDNGSRDVTSVQDREASASLYWEWPPRV